MNTEWKTDSVTSIILSCGISPFWCALHILKRPHSRDEIYRAFLLKISQVSLSCLSYLIHRCTARQLIQVGILSVKMRPSVSLTANEDYFRISLDLPVSRRARLNAGNKCLWCIPGRWARGKAASQPGLVKENHFTLDLAAPVLAGVVDRFASR